MVIVSRYEWRGGKAAERSTGGVAEEVAGEVVGEGAGCIVAAERPEVGRERCGSLPLCC